MPHTIHNPHASCIDQFESGEQEEYQNQQSNERKREKNDKMLLNGAINVEFY